MLKNCLKNIYLGQCCGQKLGVGEGVLAYLVCAAPKFDRLSTAISTDTSIDTTTVNKIQLYWVKVKRQENPPGGGNSAYERGGDARRKFCIKPLKETDLGVAQEFFDP